MSFPVTSGGLEAIQQVRLQAAREGIKVASDENKAAAEKRDGAQQQQIQERISKLQHELNAGAISRTGSAIGMIWGAVQGVAAVLAAPLAAPIIGVIGPYQQAAAIAMKLPALIGYGAMSTMMYGKISSAIATPFAVVQSNKANNEGVKIAELGSTMDEARSAGKKGSAERDLERKASKKLRASIRHQRQASDEAKSAVRNAIAGKGGGGSLVGLAGNGQMAAIDNQRCQQLLGDELSAREDLLSAEQQAASLRAEALAHTKAAAEERNSNAIWGAVLGLVEVGVEIGSMVATAGGSAAVSVSLDLASAATKSAGIFFKDDGARAHDREAEDLNLSAKAAEAKAEDARRAVKTVHEEREAIADASRERSQMGAGGQQVMANVGLNIAGIQKVRAQASLEEERDANKDAKSARRDQIATERSAIDQRRSADDAAGMVDAVETAVSIVGAAASLGGGLGGLGAFGDASGVVSDVSSVVGTVGKAGGGLASFGPKELQRERSRDAEEIDLAAKQKEDQVKSAESDRDAAKDARQRTLDRTLEMQRNMAPVLA